MLLPFSRNFKSLEISSGLCTLPALGAGPCRGHKEEERTSGWLCFNSAVLLLGDTEGLNSGSAAGTEPIILGERLFG